MSIIHILKKTGTEVQLDVVESSEEIYLMIQGETPIGGSSDGSSYRPYKKYIDSLLLTFKDGRKLALNPRFIAYVND